MTTLAMSDSNPSFASPQWKKQKKSSKTSTTSNLVQMAASNQGETLHRRHLRYHIESGKLDEAKHLYIQMSRSSTTREAVVAGVVLESMLVDAFMKSGRVDDAFWLFDSMTQRNVVTWTSVISGCRRNGLHVTALYLFDEMLHLGVLPNDFSCNAALSACMDLGAFSVGQQVHSLVVRLGLGLDARTSSCLIDFYSKCGSMDGAVQVFHEMLEPDLVALTSLITGFCKSGSFESAVGVFDQLTRLGLQPNYHTIAIVLSACGLLLGEQIHGYMIKTMLDQSLYPASALLELYSRNSLMERAKMVFSNMEEKSVVTWSSMISCCLRNEQVEDALKIFHEMISSGVRPNEFTFAAVIGACGLCCEPTSLGRQVHCSVIKLNLFSDDRISNALLTMYARNGEMEELEKVFNNITYPDIVSWCSAISGYFQNGYNEKAIVLLRHMLRKGDQPNEYGLSSVLGSCANLASLDQGRQFHCLSLKLGYDLNICVGNTLVNMYAKCGSIRDATQTFHLMPEHDLMSWNSLIHGYANLGHGNEALQVFNGMIEAGLAVADDSTIVGVLVACSHMGYVEEALRHFGAMIDQHGITPSLSHYACLVDMMGRAGRFSEAVQIINQMPMEPDTLIWKSLLGSCRLHDNLELGRLAAARVAELSPTDSARYVLLSNLHALRGEWDEADGVREMMDEKGVKKDAAQSWIEIRNEVHAFVAGDKSHPRTQAIYGILETLVKEMKEGDHSEEEFNLQHIIHDGMMPIVLYS